MSETYKQEFVCSNCGAKRPMEIPKGTGIAEYAEAQLLEEPECPHCGALAHLKTRVNEGIES